MPDKGIFCVETRYIASLFLDSQFETIIPRVVFQYPNIVF